MHTDPSVKIKESEICIFKDRISVPQLYCKGKYEIIKGLTVKLSMCEITNMETELHTGLQCETGSEVLQIRYG